MPAREETPLTFLIYLVVGAALFLAVVLPTALRRVPISAPMVLVLVGLGIGLVPGVPVDWVDPVAHHGAVEHLTELCVLVALMGVGLALDRPLSLRNWRSLKAWSASWRLLLVAMPLTIVGVMAAGMGLMGLAPATALLLGASLAPTDPVLASDVQVEGPTIDVAPDDLDEEHEVRFGLTAEAGMNDGLAFPFVHGAIAWAAAGSLGVVAWHWVWYDMLYRLVVGVACGIVVGWVLGRLAFRPPRKAIRRVLTGEPVLAVSCLALAYGAAEGLHGYGFLSVFVAAVTMRWLEPDHEYHRSMHEVTERLEMMLTLVLLLLIGMSPTTGLVHHLSWGGVAVGLLLVFVIRPLAGWLSLSIGSAHMESAGVKLNRSDRAVMSFFGVRGIGTIYYLAYATGHGNFVMEPLWATALFTIMLSVLVHGALSGKAMEWLERIDESNRRRKERRAQLKAQGRLPAEQGVRVDD